MHEETREVTEEYIDWEETKKEGKVVKKKRAKVKKEVKDYNYVARSSVIDDCIVPEIVPNKAFFTIGKLFVGSIICLFVLAIFLVFYYFCQLVNISNNENKFLITNIIGLASYLFIMVLYYSFEKKINKKIGYDAESILSRSIIALEIILIHVWILIVAIMFGNFVCFCISIVFLIVMFIFSILFTFVPEVANGILFILHIICEISDR